MRDVVYILVETRPGFDTPLGFVKGWAPRSRDWGQPSGKPQEKWGKVVLAYGQHPDDVVFVDKRPNFRASLNFLLCAVQVSGNLQGNLQVACISQR